MEESLNPYAAPSVEEVERPPSPDSDILSALATESTWKLLLLGVITFGVYWAHYVKAKSEVINRYVPQHDRISDALVYFVLISAYGSLVLFGAFLFDQEGILAQVSSGFDKLSNIALLIWGFAARRRMNTILLASQSSHQWFHGGWTFFFNVLYFNYKVNSIRDR